MTKKNSVNISEVNKETKPTEDDLKNKIQDEKFKGNCFRIDGKKITENQIKNFVKIEFINLFYFNVFRKKTKNRKLKRKSTILEKIDSSTEL